MTGLNEI